MMHAKLTKWACRAHKSSMRGTSRERAVVMAIAGAIPLAAATEDQDHLAAIVGEAAGFP